VLGAWEGRRLPVETAGWVVQTICSVSFVVTAKSCARSGSNRSLNKIPRLISSVPSVSSVRPILFS
jgi:hypothetical protein